MPISFNYGRLIFMANEQQNFSEGPGRCRDDGLCSACADAPRCEACGEYLPEHADDCDRDEVAAMRAQDERDGNAYRRWLEARERFAAGGAL